MRLRSLTMQNFRQHTDTRIDFEAGLTGIIGPNGAGKSTILEAIAWALYGKARGTRDSIRFTRAPARSPVRVELCFDLAGHRYRVVRGLTTAELYQDDEGTPIASSITGVTELLQRRLGMSRSEFFHTYFTGQKELDAMGSFGPTERARFLSRVLGYDRISLAQELVRDTRKSLVAEANGVRHSMPDKDAVLQMAEAASSRLAAARERHREAVSREAASRAVLDELTPRFNEAQVRREEIQKLDSELGVVRNEVLVAERNIGRLDDELAEIAEAKKQISALNDTLAPAAAAREALARMESLAAADARRQALNERIRLLAEEEARSDDRWERLSTAPELQVSTGSQLRTAREAYADLEKRLNAERTSWARDRQEAETRLEALLVQHGELIRQRDTLEGLGENGPCPTCGRPLGSSWRSVIDGISTQIDAVAADGSYYRARTLQLATAPKQVEQLESALEAAREEVIALERRLTRITNAVQERSQLAVQRKANREQLDGARKELEALPDGYDPARHTKLRRESEAFAETEKQVARLSGLIEREVPVRGERLRVTADRDSARARQAALEKRRSEAAVEQDDFGKLSEARDRATADTRRAELEVQAALHEVTRSADELQRAETAGKEFERLQRRLEALEHSRLVHDDLDRFFSDLRTDLNAALRPELSDVGSRFLDALTDGRYSSIELDDEYRILIMEDGLPKPVISGGEEDLCSLVLRLAISQMIAERAGQNFSLLILDEVFGSLDDARRMNVIELLRRLNHQFEQVIVITHIEQVRDGLDQVLQVAYDPVTGSSVVSRGQPTSTAGAERPRIPVDSGHDLI